MDDLAEQLSRLEEQHDYGQITDEEYRELRSHLLDRRDNHSKRLTLGVALVVLIVVVLIIVAVI